ncbi:MAG: glycosyltransferase [Jannaschia sp.]
MMRDPVVPVVAGRTIDARGLGGAIASLRATTEAGDVQEIVPLGSTGLLWLAEMPQDDLILSWTDADGAQRRLRIQIGGFGGRVLRQDGATVTGHARNLRHPGRPCVVCAIGPSGVLAHATARADDAGRFNLRLPPDVPTGTRIGIAGSDHLLNEGFSVRPTRPAAGQRPVLTRRPVHSLSIRIKISCPNLKEAPMWGDFHFANSLAAAFERLGHRAAVDTADVWEANPADEDVVLMIRGRHRIRIDRTKINLLWIISHPDRIADGELEEYDQIAVASDVYAADLRAAGYWNATTLHQATDLGLFGHPVGGERTPACLFVGNSRREYRTMVKWCVQSGVPFDLYGGGWEGVLPDGMVRATSIANADLPRAYGGHLILLNDHWDSMRENGFLSNRLFDGSASGTPIITDPVVGLSDVFGDAIAEAADIDAFRSHVEACLADPGPYLERAARARRTVLGAHTFDHRAAELSEMIDRIAVTKRPIG